MTDPVAAITQAGGTFKVESRRPTGPERMAGLVLAAAIMVGFASCAQAAGETGAIPTGHYGCLYGRSGSPGDVDIRGATYRGPSFDGEGTFKPYSMTANKITWTGPFGAFNVVSSDYRGLSNDASHRPWFSVSYRTPAGHVDSFDCIKE